MPPTWENLVGTLISLDVGGMTVDASNNMRGADHGVLFQVCDRTRVPSDEIDNDHFHADDPELAESEAAFTRTLADMVPRLELKGAKVASFLTDLWTCPIVAQVITERVRG